MEENKDLYKHLNGINIYDLEKLIIVFEAEKDAGRNISECEIIIEMIKKIISSKKAQTT